MVSSLWNSQGSNLISMSEPKLLKRFVISSRLFHTKGVSAEDRNFLSLFCRTGSSSASDRHLCGDVEQP